MNRTTKKHLYIIKSGLSLMILPLVILLFSPSGFAQEAREPKAAASIRQSIVGRWKSAEAAVEIRNNGTLTINDEEFSYEINDRVITVSGDEGSVEIPFQLKGDQLTVTFQGRRIVYARVKDSRQQKRGSGGDGDEETQSAESAAANPPELVGKWCYLSNLTGTNARMSSRCFTLNEDGTYEYSAESSSSGSTASSASQEFDSGRWSATRTTLTAYSSSLGKISYSLEKRNHPKTGDPMLIVDGDAYVTAYRKDPW